MRLLMNKIVTTNSRGGAAVHRQHCNAVQAQKHTGSETRDIDRHGKYVIMRFKSQSAPVTLTRCLPFCHVRLTLFSRSADEMLPGFKCYYT